MSREAGLCDDCVSWTSPGAPSLDSVAPPRSTEKTARGHYVIYGQLLEEWETRYGVWILSCDVKKTQHAS